MSETWRFIANIIRRRLEHANDLEEAKGRDEYTKGMKEGLCGLLKDLAEYYNAEGEIKIETFLKEGLGLRK